MHPLQRAAVEAADGSFSRSVSFACARLGHVKRGTRVAIVARSSEAAAAAFCASFCRGLIAVPVNPGYQREELAHVLDDSGASLVIVDEDVPALRDVLGARALMTARDLVAEGDAGGVVSVSDSDDALIIYTSGTTGRSKGCVHTAGGLVAGLGALMDAWGITKNDVVTHALPLFHVHGLCVATLGPLLRGARVRLVPSFSPRAIVDGVAAGASVVMTVPTMIHRLLAHLDVEAADVDVLSRLRLLTCGSAPLLPAQLEEMKQKTGLTILERYGMTETLITLTNPLDGERRAGSVGKPVPGVEMRVVDDELQVRGACVMRGYWKREDADRDVFTEERWFKTGDVVNVSRDGYVSIVGRASQDIVKVGGYKISTREIEEQLARHPSVAEVSVVGVPDVEWGEQIVAAVVLRAGCTLTLEEAQAAVALHAAKKPRRLLVVDALPRNALGKVLKTKLKEAAASSPST